MILDNLGLFSDSQSLGTTAGTTNSTSSIDLESASVKTSSDALYGVTSNVGVGHEVGLLAQIDADTAGAGTVTFRLQESADDSTFTDVLTSVAFTVAQLVAGARVLPHVLPHGITKRYIRINWTRSGTLSAGTITAGITNGVQANG